MIIIIIVGVFFGFFAYSLNYNISEINLSSIEGYLANYIWVIITSAVFRRKQEEFYQENRIDSINIELKKALSTKSEFLRNFVHEVRTPAHGFANISEGLRDNYETLGDFDRKKYIIDIAQNANRLKGLVNTLLDLSMLENGKMELKKELFDFNTCLKDMIVECNSLYLNNNSRIKIINTTFNDNENNIFADKERITQVLRNLFTNAIKFTTKKNVTSEVAEVIEVNARGAEKNGKNLLHFYIKDRGIGLIENEKKEIFSSFFTGSNNQKSSVELGLGLGLGLAISKKIIQEHNGVISATNNEEGVGAQFSFEIPLYNYEESSIEITNQTNNKSKDLADKLATNKQNITILMIEDEETCLNSMELILLSVNINLIKARSCKEGISKLQEHRKSINLLLLDMMLPDDNGVNIIAELRSTNQFANLPVVIQTGLAIDDYKAFSEELGIYGILKKPYSKIEVLNLINSLYGDKDRI
ncbi:MAG: hybrid sensor histidine kinase/response regulator [Rickettsiaceae bacterium]|nr:hybrid sensor histidine kinase/response regulator [Rickettsiaceae bacterium]